MARPLQIEPPPEVEHEDPDEPGSYADPEATFSHNDTVEWNHGIGAIVTALAAAGMHIDVLTERPSLFMQRWPFQVEQDHQVWVSPPDYPQIPLSFSLLATK